MPDRLFPALAAAVLLSACVSLPGNRGEHLPPATQVSLPDVPVPAAVDAWPREDWWTAYGDPQLDSLMNQALAGSPNLAAARARLAQAQAAVGVATGNAAPQVGIDANGSYGRQSANYLMPRPPLGKGGEYVSQGQATVNFAYDLDFWGRNAALIASARRQAEAADFDQAAARLALTTNVARAYVQLASQHELLDIAEATLKQREAIADLTRKRVAAGLDTSAEIRQAETGTASIKAEIIQLETAIAVSRLQLAALAGTMPEAAGRIGRPHLRPQPFNQPAGLPLDLLARRPEIAALRARIAAALAETEVARAQFYPNVNLAALIGFQAIGLGKLLSGDSLMSSVGPAIHLPIFEGGRLKANYALREAEAEGAIAQYNQSVLSAAEDVVEQLTRAANLEREAAATAEALSAAREAHRIALLRYREGLNSFLTVLSTETQLLAQRRAQAEVDARRIDLHISLVRALGGGFAAALPSTALSEPEKP